ncbi:MAG: YeeE/YedE family protein [Flammeovirgaceae bacterium]|nr:YeeE/YedE family protein [Flammeovirgaceae bacterium]MBE62257.1 YeeE/YedE family protein [Flammeovirgaceae bacterium]HCX23391.1 YeeE/YedE family protein [Cytophagales bacterium]|tara:strand:+ start:1480 stop:2055 length:576 start_codon:yes stop_codon:yes gene_type:complete
MNEVVEFISQPWPWYVAGPIISLVMISLILFGNSFGLSANLRTMCSIVGAGKNCEFFDFNWKSQIWNLVFAAGLVLGGVIAHLYLTPSTEVSLSAQTIEDLKALGIEQPGTHLVPMDVFSWEALLTVRGFIILVVGGFLIGFGTRYAGGCTSGHAISGLSDLQLPSLIAVVGFFIGGLFVTYLVLPFLYTL